MEFADGINPKLIPNLEKILKKIQSKEDPEISEDFEKVKMQDFDDKNYYSQNDSHHSQNDSHHMEDDDSDDDDNMHGHGHGVGCAQQ